MKLCTFEVATHVGRYNRVGVFKDGRIVDLNFATAWLLARRGEGEPQQLADALVPANLPAFLRAGLRATHAAEQLFTAAGSEFAGWWKRDAPPHGPNDETLVYTPDQVRLRAPLPGPDRLGSGEDVRALDPMTCELKMAAFIGKPGRKVPAIEARQHIAGFTGMCDFNGRWASVGPCLVTPDEIGDPYDLAVVCRLNGKELGRSSSETLRGRFEQRIETLSSDDPILPCDVIAFRLDLAPPAKPGDVVELEIERVGVLRSRVAARTGS